MDRNGLQSDRLHRKLWLHRESIADAGKAGEDRSGGSSRHVDIVSEKTQGIGASESGVEACQRVITEGVRLFFPGGARPPTEVIAIFVDQHKEQYGIERVCKQIQIAPSSYYEYKARQRGLERLSDRVKRDRVLERNIQKTPAQLPHQSNN